MDIEFIEEKDRDSVFKLMELCGLDMSEAYQLYLNADSSLQKAMQMHFNEGPTHNSVSPSYSSQESNDYPTNYTNYESNGDEDQFDVLYQKYKAYRNSGITFGNRYEIRKNSSFLGGFVPKFLKGEPQSNFKKLAQTYIGRPCPIKFSAQSLSCTLAESQKFPTAVYILDFSAAVKGKIEQMLRNNQIAEMVNVQFKNVGIDPNYQIEKKLVQFVDRKKFNNCIVVLRVNAVEEIQTISHINLVTSTFKQVLEKLKLAKNACISKDLDDGHLERRLNEELMGNFDYQKPMSIAERRKVAQDRQIRKKQQEQFFASMKVQEKKQQSNHSQSKQPQQSTQVGKNASTSKQPMANKPEPPKRNIGQQRKQLREKLKIYTQGMNIKLRLPNGEAIILTVDQSEKGNYLFNYVESIDKDIGFQKDNERKFDIIRPYDKLNIGSQLDRSLKDIFEGSDSENLVVSERD